ncbi:MAG: phenylalanine--tRNA ligase subunit beta [Planctomycetota bacterium]|nr:MAG: phenylalanine--tRNA ligase subunit beta [Planctomycetota bacterium]
MIVSWDWLKEYVALEMPRTELERRLMMAGLNHEGTEVVEGDAAIDLEVTSNRPDCLGHLGVAREVAVLFDTPLKVPAAEVQQSSTPVAELAQVKIECADLCPRYTARVIRRVKVGPSPDWLVARLRTLGIASINNVVDVTNYVLMECGQPLHAFDLAKLAESRIVVRRAARGERFEAINHKEYELDPDVCVIADATRAVAIGGVMGGAETEVTESTRDVLIESAAFAAVSIRATARKLNLHSDSSFRFERGPDPESVEWASRRCCELILEVAGGELASGMIDAGKAPVPREPVTLRLGQVERIMGIPVPPDEVRRILTALGTELKSSDDDSLTVVPPSWRSDLTREIDLVEEVARIYGYEEIPEDSRVPMVPSHKTEQDRLVEKVHSVLLGAGFDEAMTTSVVDEATSEAFSPWTDAAPLRTSTPLLRGATRLRRSLVPSLLTARRLNETLGNDPIELFELANIYLPQRSQLPVEERMLALTSGGDYFQLKGVLEAILAEIAPEAKFLISKDVPGGRLPLLSSRSAELVIGTEVCGYLGEVDASFAKRHFDLRRPASVAELMLRPLFAQARDVARYRPLSAYPAVTRDINFEVAQDVRWADLLGTVNETAGDLLETVEYIETYRDRERLGADKKSLVFKLSLRRDDGTLTSEEADRLRDAVERACHERHGAVLRS